MNTLEKGNTLELSNGKIVNVVDLQYSESGIQVRGKGEPAVWIEPSNVKKIIK